MHGISHQAWYVHACACISCIVYTPRTRAFIELSLLKLNFTFTYLVWCSRTEVLEIRIARLLSDNSVLENRVLPDLRIKVFLNFEIIKNIIRHSFWVSFLKFLWADLKIWLETLGNISKSAKFLLDLRFNLAFVDICTLPKTYQNVPKRTYHRYRHSVKMLANSSTQIEAES